MKRKSKLTQSEKTVALIDSNTNSNNTILLNEIRNKK